MSTLLVIYSVKEGKMTVYSTLKGFKQLIIGFKAEFENFDFSELKLR